MVGNAVVKAKKAQHATQIRLLILINYLTIKSEQREVCQLLYQITDHIPVSSKFEIIVTDL